MKKIILLKYILILSSIYTYAQQMNTKYSFLAGTNATLQSMIGADTLIGANVDDGNSPSISLPNFFYFNGVAYTSFKANSNGTIELGKITNSFPYKGPLSNAEQLPTFAPYLIDGHTSATGNVLGLYDGINDVYTIQWKTAIPYTNTTPNSTFQVQLHFADYSIHFFYGNCAGATAGAIGIIEDNGFYSTVNPITNTASSDSINNVYTVPPASGTYYGWTPIASPTLYGKVGIGTGAPSTNLDVKGNIRIRGGSPASNKVLTCDALGFATWQTINFPVIINEVPTNATTNNTLRFNGMNWVQASGIQIDATNNTTINNNLKIPTGASANKILTSDATGNATWQTPATYTPPSSIAFCVKADSNRTLNSTTFTKLHFGISGVSAGNYNIGSAYDVINDEFVAPSAGIYSFTSNIFITNLTTTFSFSTNFKVTTSANILKTESSFENVCAILNSITGANYNTTVVFDLQSGDKVSLLCRQNNASSTAIVLSGGGSIKNTSFSGFKIN